MHSIWIFAATRLVQIMDCWVVQYVILDVAQTSPIWLFWVRQKSILDDSTAPLADIHKQPANAFTTNLMYINHVQRCSKRISNFYEYQPLIAILCQKMNLFIVLAYFGLSLLQCKTIVWRLLWNEQQWPCDLGRRAGKFVLAIGWSITMLS
jgi:hypothetical protein